MKQNFIISYSRAILLLPCFLFLISCEKDPTSLGLDIQPSTERDLSVTQASIQVNAKTMEEVRITSDERSYSVLGCYNDPVFGVTSADIVSQFRMSTSTVSISNTVAIDSVVLSLAYYSKYTSDTITPQRLQVYEFKGNIATTDTLYSNMRLVSDSNYYPAPLADFTYIPNTKDTTLDIKLSNEFGRKLVVDGNSSLSSVESFASYFKGLYIKADESMPGNNIFYYNLLSSFTKLTVYFTGGSYSFIVNSNCARANIYRHSYTSAVLSSFNDSNSTYLYSQSLSGPRIFVKFPELVQYKNADTGLIAVHKAELVLKVDESTIGDYAPPAKLLMVAVDADGKYLFVDDYLKNHTYFGGSYNSTTKSYKFNIPLHIQNILLGAHTDYGFYIFPESNRTTANRAVIFNSGANKISLNIAYSHVK